MFTENLLRLPMFYELDIKNVVKKIFTRNQVPYEGIPKVFPGGPNSKCNETCDVKNVKKINLFSRNKNWAEKTRLFGIKKNSYFTRILAVLTTFWPVSGRFSAILATF